MKIARIVLCAAVLLVAATAGCTSSTCAPDSTVAGCVAGDGWSCTGGDTPDQSDPNLFCSDGVPGNAGSTLFCCVTFSATTTCGVDRTVAGCVPGSIGFSCTGVDTPDMGDPTLNCSAGVPGNAGSTLFCCVPM